MAKDSELCFHVPVCSAAQPSSLRTQEHPAWRPCPCPTLATAETSDQASGLSSFLFRERGRDHSWVRSERASQGPSPQLHLYSLGPPGRGEDLGLEPLSHAHTLPKSEARTWGVISGRPRERNVETRYERRKVVVALECPRRGWKGTHGSQRGRWMPRLPLLGDLSHFLSRGSEQRPGTQVAAPGVFPGAQERLPSVLTVGKGARRESGGGECACGTLGACLRDTRVGLTS